MRVLRLIIVVIAAGTILWISLFSPRLTFKVEEMYSGVRLYQAPVKEGDGFVLEFVHSVERTPVKEVFRIERDGKIYLVETEYESFGAGLPTMPDEREESVVEGGKIRITGMRREIEPFLVAVSPVPGHVLTVGGEEVVLASLAKPGTGLRIRVVREPLLAPFLGRRYEWMRGQN
ncbi:MAG: DUF1850 domain-containing protein [Firmicutes bacterium]|jgi:hypothetical protein|nr:DUF1850 domain-containing protein [Bacillota bacterium]